MKRFCVDWWGNWIFFVPLVTILSGFVVPIVRGNPTWNWAIWTDYALASVFIAALGGPLYVLFLKYFWYPLTNTKF